MWESKHGFGEPFIDIDEWRDTPRRHRYVHGGFAGTRTLFSFYLPPPELYDGRVVQYLEGGAGGHEALIAGGGYGRLGMGWLYDVAFEDLGALLVESNQGHFPNEGTGFANAVELYGASAESARFAWTVAEEMYGRAPHHTYVWGVSGGGCRSMNCIEEAPEVYDGACPHANWSGGGLRLSWSAAAYWWLQSRHKLQHVVDAMSPGGSGNPFEGLTVEERDGLATVYRAGYPRGGENQLWQFAPWLWNLIGEKHLVEAHGPEYLHNPYYENFWNTPGHLGHDNPGAIAHLVIDQPAKVGRVIRLDDLPSTSMVRVMAAGALAAGEDNPFGIELAEDLDDNTRLFGALLTFKTGKAAGRAIFVTGVDGRILTTSGEMHGDLFAGVEAGDELQVDNHVFIAFCHLHRHSLDLPSIQRPDPVTGEKVLPPEFGGARAWMLDGLPLYPQVPPPPPGPGPINQTGQFTGKVIHVNQTHDSMIWPNGAHGWTRKVMAHLGDQLDERYRLWWVENAPHGAPEMIGPFATSEKNPAIWRSRLVAYDGVSAQALRDIARWVEQGVPPPKMAYEFSADGELELSDSAAARGGVQPLVRATANGGERADVKVGDVVRFEGFGEQPPGAGSLLWGMWDFEGRGEQHHREDAEGESCKVAATHSYTQPGTYFAAFRVGAHRQGRKGRGPAAENIARVRVVVS